MADITTKSIRNIVLLGHGGSGKTSVAEAALYLAKATDRLGKTTAGLHKPAPDGPESGRPLLRTPRRP